MIRIERLTGRELQDSLPEVARLRIKAFRDRDSAILVGVCDNGVLVGASTGAPLEEPGDDLDAAFEVLDIPINEDFYCTESMLLPNHRRQGIGHTFFDAGEAHG